MTETDRAWYQPHTYAGFSLHDELGLLVRAGLTPAGSLRVSTMHAKFVGREKNLGTVAAENVADLVLLEANPLEHIRNTSKIDTVILGVGDLRLTE